IVGFGVSFRAAPVYVSSATIGVTPVADSLWPAPPEAQRQRVMQQVEEIQLELLSRASLSAIINDPRLLLYRWELRNEPLEDVIDGMRRNIRMTRLPQANGNPASIALSISFFYPDAPAARATVGLLTSKFLALNQSSGRFHNQIYRDFWQDMASVEHLKSVPPAPVPEIADVLSVASLPVRMEPNRFLFLAWGFGTGTLLGLLAMFVTR